MKKTIITAAAVICTAFGSFAQSATSQPAMQAAPATSATKSAQMSQTGTQQMQHQMPSPEERAKRMTDQLNTAVQLSPEQYKKAMDVHKDFMTKMDAFRTANQPTPGQAQPAAGATNNRGEQFKKMNEDKDTQLKAILTPEQWQKWQDSHKMMPHPGAGNMQPVNGQPATGQPQQK